MNIGMIGNFGVPYTTENERKWSFEKLGHSVVTFQENETTVNELRQATSALDMLVYSHTHGWDIPGLKTFFHEDCNIPTVSIHLDKWIGLEREKDVGKEATWFTDYVFMADGSPEAVRRYTELRLNWYWLEPGVVERDCYQAPPDHNRFPHDIVFIGSRGYHPEYPWRPYLIDWLKETYGDRFAHHGNDGLGTIRGHDLNVLCSSAKIAVGDSCFAGQTSNYFSDRAFELMGRNSFVIHPKIKGLELPGMAEFEAGNIHDLHEKIEYYLSHDEEREKMRAIGFQEVKENHTYTQRAQTVIDIVC
jgi:hypothetical protein